MFETPMENLAGWMGSLAEALDGEEKAVEALREALLRKEHCKKAIIACLKESFAKQGDGHLTLDKCVHVSRSCWPHGDSQLVGWRRTYDSNGVKLTIIPVPEGTKPEEINFNSVPLVNTTRNEY